MLIGKPEKSRLYVHGRLPGSLNDFYRFYRYGATQIMTRRKRWLLLMGAGGAGSLFLFALFWVLLLLGNDSAIVQNYEKRIAMFTSLTRNRRRGGGWRPRQGENWIF